MNLAVQFYIRVLPFRSNTNVQSIFEIVLEENCYVNRLLERVQTLFQNTNIICFSLLNSIAKAIKPETQQKKEKAQQKTAEERVAAKKTRRIVCINSHQSTTSNHFIFEDEIKPMYNG